MDNYECNKSFTNLFFFGDMENYFMALKMGKPINDSVEIVVNLNFRFQ